MLLLFLYGNSDLLAWFTALLNQEDENLVYAAALQVSGAFAMSGASLQREGSQHIPESVLHCISGDWKHQLAQSSSMHCTHTQFHFDRELLLAWRNTVMKQSHDKNKHRVAVKLFQVMPGTSALLIHSGSKPYFVAADSPTPCSFLSSLYWWPGCCGWSLPGRWNQLT